MNFFFFWIKILKEKKKEREKAKVSIKNYDVLFLKIIIPFLEYIR